MPGEKGITFAKNATHEQLYNPKRTTGLVRKAIVVREQDERMFGPGVRFVDQEFSMVPPANSRMVRLYDFYKKEVDLFPYNETESSFIEPQDFYNSFMGESGVISYGYTRTLFITQTVNPNGYYKYFVKRNGEYFVE